MTLLQRFREKEIGKKLHKLLNNVVARELTIAEYKKVVELISEFSSQARFNGRKEVVAEIRNWAITDWNTKFFSKNNPTGDMGIQNRELLDFLSSLTTLTGKHD